ncbi:hypothetical protein TNCV_2356631 [Trichonephila clavipes]|nr:hypothetical protein TNCV_2356631 [Trichonephila clavipes]
MIIRNAVYGYAELFLRGESYHIWLLQRICLGDLPLARKEVFGEENPNPRFKKFPENSLTWTGIEPATLGAEGQRQTNCAT